MNTTATLLNPQAFRTRVLKRGRLDKRKDGGFSLIEIMAGMAIIAILALAILPQFSKFFERAAVQNLSAEVSNAALLVESDYSLTGKTTYVKANVDKSVLDSKKAPESGLTATLLDSKGAAATGTAYGFEIVGKNPGVSHYTVIYKSTGANPGLVIAAIDEAGK